MIQGKKTSVCITGASRGLGKALTIDFLKRGYRVFAVTRHPEQLQEEVEAHPKDLQLIPADICLPEGREQVKAALKDAPPLSILIHNAATLVYRPFAELSEAELRRCYEVNVFAPFLLTQVLMPLMKETHILSISSVGGVQGSLKFGGLSAYSSSKAALNCLTEMWQEEYKASNLSFNCLALGSVETEMFKTAFPGVQAAARAEEMAAYIANFAESAGKLIKGKIISVSSTSP